MADITLSNYVGFIFSEVVRARSLADAETKRIALLYQEDEILKHFSVPRFKIPELDLTIPVLISGARYRSLYEFRISYEDFYTFIYGKLKSSARTIITKVRLTTLPTTPPTKATGDVAIFATRADLFSRDITALQPVLKGAALRTASANSGGSIDENIKAFYQELVGSPDLANPDEIVETRWTQLFQQMLVEQGLTETYKKLYPNNELLKQTNGEVLAFVKQHIVVVSTSIENILVDPETQNVKDGSNENSVFIVKAKIMEDGIIIKDVTGAGGKTEKMVEFD